MDDSFERYLNGPSQNDTRPPAGLTDKHRGGHENGDGVGAGPSLIHHAEVLHSGASANP
jgi:trimethylamine monooxygenase